MREAWERGIAFFDVARYDDRTGTAPLRTGLRALADETGATPAALAIAWALAAPRLAGVLFGATTPARVAENARAPAILDELGAERLAGFRRIGA